MRKIFTIFGDDRELKLLKQFEELQDTIKEERRLQREAEKRGEKYPTLAFKARSEQEYALSTQLHSIYSSFCEGNLRDCITSLINLHKSLLETYKNHQ